MKYKAIVLIISLLYVTPLFAQEQNVQILQTREEIRQKISEKNLELQVQILEKQAEIKTQINSFASENQKTKLQIFAQERILKTLTKIFDRYEAVLIKFDGIVARIDTRIAKLEETNINTDSQKQLLALAKQNIQDSTVLLAATKLELENLIKAEVSKEQIKMSIELCKTSLKATHQSLLAVIATFKSEDTSFDNSIDIE